MNLAEEAANPDRSVTAREIFAVASEYSAMQQLYRAALREIETKLRILDDEFQVKYSHNPVHQLESRLKDPISIREKLTKRGLPLNLKSAMENLTDLAGIRVICPYINDVYMTAELITSQDDITLLRKSDYIESPKPNGYRSLHLVVSVPVFLANSTENVPVEIQIRTIAMDFWASLEHELHYKQAAAGVAAGGDPLIKERLSECARQIASLDLEMQQLHKEIMTKV